MTLEQKRELYLKDAKVMREYRMQDIDCINEKGIRFRDGYWLDFVECRECFPIRLNGNNKHNYIGARCVGSFWQFFVEQGSVVILCDNIDDYCEILSEIGFLRSFDLS
jgi:hypothetical protein